MKKIVSVLLLMSLFLGLFGCVIDRTYGGEYPELYTVAVYSIPDAEGFMYHGEGAFDSEIYIWEQDDYGRTLFAYCEDYGNRVFSLIICQAFDDKNVYFYPDANYVLTVLESEYIYSSFSEEILKNRTEAFYLENKEALKEANDWNKPLDKTKCVYYPITNKKNFGGKVRSLNSVQCNEILNEYSKTLNLPNPDQYPHQSHDVLQVDENGKILLMIRGSHPYYDNPDWSKTDPYTYYKIVLWVITDCDGNYDKENGVMVMYSTADKNEPFIYNASEVLDFKEKNGWKAPFCTNE